MLFSKRLAYFD